MLQKINRTEKVLPGAVAGTFDNFKSRERRLFGQFSQLTCNVGHRKLMFDRKFATTWELNSKWEHWRTKFLDKQEEIDSKRGRARISHFVRD